MMRRACNLRPRSRPSQRRNTALVASVDRLARPPVASRAIGGDVPGHGGVAVKLSAWCIAAMLVLPAGSAAQQGTASVRDSAAQLIARVQPPTMPAGPVSAPRAPEFPRGGISGLTFADLSYNVVGYPDSLQPNIDGARPIGRDLNGIQIRRVYFQLDNDLSVRWSTRFRLEADSKALTS